MGATRQVEIAGAQTITGDKTIDIANIKITGGADGDMLTTDGTGDLAWTAAPPATVTVNAPLSGTGTSGSPITLTVATGAQVSTGTNDVNPITSLTLRSVTGDLDDLDTTADANLVAAINELVGNIGDLTTLDTTAQTDIVSAINEIFATADTALQTVSVTTPLTGNGTAGNPIALGTVPINLGGTNATTAAAALDNLSATTTTDAGVLTRAAGTPGVWSLSTVLSAVSVTAPITGNGTAGDPLALTMASAADITGGTNTTNPVSAAGLRQLMGADVAALQTTATTIIPAINELLGDVQALMAGLRFVGTVTPGNVFTPAAGGPAAGLTALPAADPDNEGWVAIITGADATGVAPLPTVGMTAGDWVVSTGTAWIHLDLNLPATAAQNVSITTIAGSTSTNVQDALTEIFGGGMVAVEVDGVSIIGDGTTGDPLEVATIDAGTF